ncbi:MULTISPECIES: hypothetical protein [unclassified Streptomyces]|uniref:hypothetical protein n=1 Tax=unclassified Streptomyces TaxID=2593676 RepID=UPI003321D54F
MTEYPFAVVRRLEPVRIIRHQHPVCSETRRPTAAFLARERVRQILTAAFAVPAPFLVPAVKLSPGR